MVVKLSPSCGGRTDDSPEKLVAEVISRLGECEVRDQHRDYIHFWVRNTGNPWHHIFRQAIESRNTNI